MDMDNMLNQLTLNIGQFKFSMTFGMGQECQNWCAQAGPKQKWSSCEV